MPAWYGGYPLLQPTKEIYEWISEFVPVASVIPNHIDLPWARVWNNNQEHLPTFPPLEINKLFWPSGCNRFGTFYGLVDDATLTLIRAACYGESGDVTQVAQELVIDATPTTDDEPELNTLVRADMFMLPPRPLSLPTLPNSLWLIILVDERYLWWRTDTDEWGNDPRTDWQDVFNSCRDLLGYDASNWHMPTAIDDNYQFPADFIAKASFQPVPIVLNAALWSVNRRLVYDFKPYDAGFSEVAIQTVDEAKTVRDAFLAKKPVVSGGLLEIRENPATYRDAGGILPRLLRMTFPRANKITGEVLDGAHEETAYVEDFTGFEAYTGTLGFVTFQNDMKRYSDGSDDSKCGDLANIFFDEWLRWAVEEYVDVTLPYLWKVPMSGLYEAVEIIDNIWYTDKFTTDGQSPYAVQSVGKLGRSYTRIYRPGYDSRPVQLWQQANQPGSGSGGHGSGSGSGGGDGGIHHWTFTFDCASGTGTITQTD